MNAPSRHNLTDRELRWLRHIAIHGPQSSEFLLELSADTHSCRDTGLRTLQKLRETGYLRLPSQQRQIAKADFNPHVYELTRRTELHLRGLGDPEPVPPTGHWWHSFLTASTTSAIAIEVERRGYRYIPAHAILARNNAALAIQHSRQKLIPDQLFAIDYGGTYRSFVLEVDRGTEPYASTTARKSLRRMISSYAELSAKDTLRRHYGLKSPLLILMVFANPARAARCLEELATQAQNLGSLGLVGVAAPGFPRYQPVQALVSGPWQRAQGSAVRLFDRLR